MSEFDQIRRNLIEFGRAGITGQECLDAWRKARQILNGSVRADDYCQICLDAHAVQLQPAPWGGEMGVCAACAASS